MRSIAVAFIVCFTSCSAAEGPRNIDAQLTEDLRKAEAAVAADGRDTGALLQRGDAHFFLGKFDEAIADYDRMIELQPQLGPRHWQRGLALFFAGRYDDSARQFERYYEGDQGDKSDRENGIWRFYAQVRKENVEKARKQLLRYDLPDREPLPIIYRMCEGTVTPAQVLAAAESAKVSEAERTKRRFYANLYVGLNAWIVQDDAKSARDQLEKAVANHWPRDAGYGGNFMWHVARLSLAQLDRASTTRAAESQEHP